MSEAGLDAWLRRARPGERLVYARGPYLLRCSAADHVRSLYQRREIDLHQRRATGCVGLEYLAVRLERARTADAQREAPASDEALDKILAIFRRETNFGRPASSDAQLARAVGLATAPQAAWRVAKLRKAGLIRTQVVTDDPEIKRVVTIVATGRRTKAPASWERFSAAVREGGE